LATATARSLTDQGSKRVISGSVDHVGGLTRVWQVPVNRPRREALRSGLPPDDERLVEERTFDFFPQLAQLISQLLKCDYLIWTPLRG
jgi:hypothetical protein